MQQDCIWLYGELPNKIMPSGLIAMQILLNNALPPLPLPCSSDFGQNTPLSERNNEAR